MARNTEDEILNSVLPEWHKLLQGWSADGSLVAAAQEALLLQGEPPQGLKDLATQWASGNFSGIPPIALLSSAEMTGAMGAYAMSTGNIYLNADWVASASKELVFAVLTEELGHHLDSLLNASDTVGDEGEYFARLLSGEDISVVDSSALRTQDDWFKLGVQGVSLAVEGALVSNSNIKTTGNALVQSSAIDLVSVDNGYGAAWSKSKIDLSKDWSTSFVMNAGGGSGTSDGFTFTINGDPRGISALGDGGQNLGFFGLDTGLGITNSYAVLFDMWASGPASLLGFAQSTNTSIPQGTFQLPLSLANNSYSVALNYSATSEILSVAIGNQVYQQSIDLQSTLGTSAYLGLTAANGGGTMDMVASAWDITATEVPPPPVVRGNSLYSIVDAPSWLSAENSSVKLGGHLTSIGSFAENDFLVNTFESLPSTSQDGLSLFIGYTDQATEGNWIWTDGSITSFTNWSTGEPNNGNGFTEEDFSTLFPGTTKYGVTGKWNDTPGNISTENKGIAEIPFLRRGDSAYVIVQGPTREEAEANAVKLGGHLVISESAEETEWLRRSFYPGEKDGLRSVFWQGKIETSFTPPTFWYDKWHGVGGTYWVDMIAEIREPDYNYTRGIAEIKLAPNSTPIGTPTLSGTFKAGQVITIDRTPLQDADNFTGYIPYFKYSWETSTDGTSWTRLNTADASDNDTTYILTSAEIGMKVRGVVSYIDGYGTDEIIVSDPTGYIPPTITLAIAPASVAEDGTANLLYTFSRSGPTTNPLTVNYTVGGTATLGTDYTGIDPAAAVKSVSFTAGSSTAVVSVDPTADTTIEANETVALTLAAGAGYSIGTTAAVTGTITNDDPRITLAVSPASVTEDGTTNLVFSFSRTGLTTNPLTVNYTVSGTATLGTDYTGISATGTTKTVTFAAGSATATVTVDATADTEVEANETVGLKLASGTGYTIGTTTTVNGTITNDDLPVISLAVDSASVTEDGAANILYTFSRTGPTTSALTVKYTVAGTATLGSDYTGISATGTTKTVTFAAGSATAVVTVDPTADTEVEANETVGLKLSSRTSYTIGTTATVNGTITNDDISSSTTYTLTAPESSLQLLGTQRINAIGNELANTLIGNSSNNRLYGLQSGDVLTGGGTSDADIFAYQSLSETLLLDPITGDSGFDRITDFNSNDRILTPLSVVTTLLSSSTGTATALTASAVAAVLTNTTFQANSVAAFNVSGQAGTFIAMNDNRGGFQTDTDAVLFLQNYNISTINSVDFL